MTYSEIVDQVQFEGRQQDFPAVTTLIEMAVNREYRSAVKKIAFRELLVYGEEFTTEADTVGYTAPYPLLQVLPGSILFNYQGGTGLQTGYPIQTIVSAQSFQQARVYGQSCNPLGMGVSGSIGTALYSMGTASVANESTAVVGVGTTWTTDMEGEWIQFGYSATSTASGGDYGYLIDEVTSGTTLTLVEAYRGPSLTDAQYSIRPASSPRLLFAPNFTNTGTVTQYTWLRAPRRLYNPGDEPEVSQIGDYLVSKVIAATARYNRDAELSGAFEQQARNQLRELVQEYAV